MRYPPLHIEVKHNTWRMADHASVEADEAFQRVRPQVLRRDRHACRFCGFRSQKWQEVHHVNGDHHDNRPANLVTVCFLCHNVFHIGRAGQMGEVTLIYAPDFYQQDLHHLARALWVARSFGDEWAEIATEIEVKMRAREDWLDRRLGTHDPQIIGSLLLELGEEQARRVVRERLKGLRVWPVGRKIYGHTDTLPKIVEYWTQNGPYSGIKPTVWPHFVKAAQRRLSQEAA